jgi:crossover junction endodeoxyribonuclease RusA
MNEVILPWPPSKLMPNNKKSHWATKAKIAKEYRQACCALTKEAQLTVPDGKIELIITFCPPDKRRRDWDNCISAFKSGQDGFAEALGVNDYNFLPTYKFTDDIKGWVKIQIPSV